MYQTRHTFASLMLGLGENPNWVASTLGHASTEMLFKKYIKFIPNLTRRDGSAFLSHFEENENLSPYMDTKAVLGTKKRGYDVSQPPDCIW